MTKKIIAALMLLGTLQACSATDERVDTPYTEADYLNAPPTVEDLFVDVLEDEGFSGTKIEMVDVAHDICGLFDDGVTFEDLLFYANTSIQTVAEAHDFGFFVGASIAAFCPEYESQIP